MKTSITERRRRVRRAVTAGSAALLAGAWGVVAVAGKGAGTSAAATSAGATAADATTADPTAVDTGTDDLSVDDGTSAQDQAPAITSSQS